VKKSETGLVICCVIAIACGAAGLYFTLVNAAAHDRGKDIILSIIMCVLTGNLAIMTRIMPIKDKTKRNRLAKPTAVIFAMAVVNVVLKLCATGMLYTALQWVNIIAAGIVAVAVYLRERRKSAA
jgi:small-conductance mechanosensitive channel